MKKAERAEMELRTKELERIAAVDDENVGLRLQVAELKAEVARATRLASSEKEARLGTEKRLSWISLLVSGRRPIDLGD